MILSPAQMRFCRLGADCLVGRQGQGAGCDHHGAGLTCLEGSSHPVAICRGQPSPTEVRDLPTATGAQVGREPSLRDGSVQSDILCLKAWPRSTAADCSQPHITLQFTRSVPVGLGPGVKSSGESPQDAQGPNQSPMLRPKTWSLDCWPCAPSWAARTDPVEMQGLCCRCAGSGQWEAHGRLG